MRALRLALYAPLAAILAVPSLARDDPPTELARLRRELLAGDLEAATATGESLVVTDADCGECWGLLGRVHAQSRRFLAAQSALERARDLDALDAAGRLTLAAVLWENGATGEAAELLEPLAVGRGEAAAIARHQMARLSLWAGDYEAATRALARHVAEHPDNLEARLDLARAATGSGDLDLAREQFEIYLAAVPTDAGAVYGLARVLQRSGEEDAAAARLGTYSELRRQERQRQIVDGQRRARLDQAAHLIASGHAVEAEALLAGLAPDASALGLRARALWAMGETGRALETLERAVALDPRRADLRSLLQQWAMEGGR